MTVPSSNTQAQIQAVASATGYVSQPLTSEQQQIADVYGSGNLPIGTSQATPANTPVPIYNQGQVNQSGQTPVGYTNSSGENVATPATSSGVGAGTTGNSTTSINSDNNPTQTTPISGTTQNNVIVPQPNVLDQYDSYTYSLSWYLLGPTQYNNYVLSKPFNVAGWQLLMQSGGAPIKGRNQYFPVDFYMDDLEIDSQIPMGGTGLPYSALSMKWKVVEPNGITLLPRLVNAVNALYKNANPSINQQIAATQDAEDAAAGGQTTNATSTNQPDTTYWYARAQYCMVIQFYGYDSKGNLVYPATGQYTTTGQLGGPTQAVITKYYPFMIKDIKYRVTKGIVEYQISAVPVPHMINAGTERATIPYAFQLTGATVGELLSGTGAPGTTSSADPGARTSSSQPTNTPQTLTTIATGQDNPLVTTGGMDFTAGNF